MEYSFINLIQGRVPLIMIHLTILNFNLCEDSSYSPIILTVDLLKFPLCMIFLSFVYNCKMALEMGIIHELVMFIKEGNLRFACCRLFVHNLLLQVQVIF